MGRLQAFDLASVMNRQGLYFNFMFFYCSANNTYGLVRLAYLENLIPSSIRYYLLLF